jgi:electron transport complex protein RnfG
MNTEPIDMENENDHKSEQDNGMTLAQSILRGAFGLSLFAVITAGLIALTQTGTAERIKAEIKKARAAALYEIVPLSEHDNDLLSDTFWIKAQALGLAEKREAFIARKNDQANILILPLVAPDGYTGEIHMVLGVNLAGEISGLRILKHKETPGLGDKIELKKSDWVLGFNGKSLTNTSKKAWAVKKDGGEFDQLTGATITPRVIVAAVYRALKVFDKYKDAIVNKTQGELIDLDNYITAPQNNSNQLPSPTFNHANDSTRTMGATNG